MALLIVSFDGCLFLFTACVALTSDLVTKAPKKFPTTSTIKKAALHTEVVNTHFDGTINNLHHAIFATSVGDNDTYTLKGILQQDDQS